MEEIQNDDDDRLARHVNRIVTASYAVSLKDLHCLVQGIEKKNEHPRILALRRWVDAKPCQVDALAAAILEGLHEWPYVFEILTAFASSSKTFRDVVLRLQPTLLDEFLKKAVDGDEKAFGVCISLLSHPLPEGVPAPASLTSFFSKTMERMVQKPCPETAKCVYSLMSGIHTTILEVLPEDTLVKFLTECKKTLQNLEDHMGNLLCLATLAKISSPYTTPDERGEDTSSNEGIVKGGEAGKEKDNHAPWLRSILQFFGPKHGMKTLDLVVMRVIFACSASSNLSIADSIFGIQLARGICGAVEFEQRNSWIRTSGPKLVKLCEKIVRPGIDPKVQIMGMVFLASLLEVNMVPKEIITLAQQTLLSPMGRQNLDALSEEFIPLVIKKLSESQSVKSSIATVLATPTGQKLYEQVMTFQLPNKGDICGSSSFCPTALLNVLNQLHIDLSTIFLSAYLPSSHDKEPLAAAPSRTHALLLVLRGNMGEKQARFKACHSHPTNPQRFDFVTSFSRTRPPPSPYSTHSPLNQHTVSSHIWKDVLAEDLLSGAQQSHQAIIQRVSAVCRDLEERCEGVEAPLRDLTAKLDKMTTDCESARGKNDELEKELNESSQIIAALKDDNSKLKHQAQSSQGRVDNLSTRLRATQKDLEDLKHRSKKEIAASREKTRETELEFLATVTSRDDTIDELHRNVSEANTQLESLQEQIIVVSNEKSEVQQSLGSLERQLAQSKQSEEAKTKLNTELQEEISRLRADKEHMLSISDRLNKFDEAVRGSKDHSQELREKEETHRNELDALKREEEAKNSKLTAEIKQQKKIHKEEVRKLQASLHGAESKSAQNIQARDKRIETLERKVALLRQERETKAREFSEAQGLSTKLMALMDKRSFDQNESQCIEATTKVSPGPAHKHPNTSTIEEGDTEEEQFKTQVSYQGSFGSFASSNSTNAGPTPKRPKSSKASKKPSTSLQGHNSSDKTSENRKPLRETDLNQSPINTTSESGAPQSSSNPPDNSQDTKLGSQFDIFEGNDDSCDYSDVDLEDLEYLDNGRFTSTPSM
ncbi:hypothetical protein FQN54_004852 [Arachnomyces sp. PD_36]|nr:hypothetical protein FQN54_004852 [Arachnomyces sp. PD_36]